MQRSHLVIAVLCIATVLGLGLSPEPLMAQTPSGCCEAVASGGSGASGLVTPALPASNPVTPTRGACTDPVVPCFGTPKSSSVGATPQPAQASPIIIEPALAGAATPVIIAPAVSGQESPAIITVTPAQSETSPQVIQPEVVPLPSATLPAPAYWTDPILNGGFEENLTYWNIDASGDAPMIVDAEVHSGLRAVRLGAAQGAVEGTSSISQDIVVPSGFNGIALDFWVYPWAEAEADNDYQEATLLASNGSTHFLLRRDQSDARVWTRQTVPITGFSGQSVTLQFSVYNDGAGGSTGMILDDVSLVALGPENQAQGAEAASPDAVRLVVADPVEPSVTRIALVVTALPPAPILVQASVEPEIEVVISSPNSTPETAASSRRRITDRWPKNWWLILIPIIAVVVALLLARRSRT